MKNLLMIVLILSTVGIYKVNAQEPKVVISDKTGWHKIGETTANFQKDTDEIVILGADKFASIQFKITEAPIDLTSIVVHYESGDVQKVPVNMQINAPGESKTIDLNGGERNLKKIVFVYKTVPKHNNQNSHVEIWGLKTNTDRK